MSTDAPHPTATDAPTTTTTGSRPLDAYLEAIRAAVASGASAEARAHGAAACRAILAALDAEPGKPIAIGSAPAAHPLAGLDPGTALDLLIAKLSAALPKDDGTSAGAPSPDPRGLRIAFVAPPPRPEGPRPGARPVRRKP